MLPCHGQAAEVGGEARRRRGAPGRRGLKAARSRMARTSPVPSRASMRQFVSCRMSTAEFALREWQMQSGGEGGSSAPPRPSKLGEYRPSARPPQPPTILAACRPQGQPPRPPPAQGLPVELQAAAAAAVEAEAIAGPADRLRARRGGAPRERLRGCHVSPVLPRLRRWWQTAGKGGREGA